MTVTILTLLDDEFPLIYTIVPNASNGEQFVSFIQACIPYIFDDDIIIGDNCSFHHGWSAELARLVISNLGAQYKLLPKYCPEWSPAEHVFSYLKAALRATSTAKDYLKQRIVAVSGWLNLHHCLVPKLWRWSCVVVGWLQMLNVNF